LTQPRWGKTVGRALSQTRYATLGYEPQPLRGKDQFLRLIATSFLNAKPVGDDYFNRHNGSRRLPAWR
jgi:hypothetical protein